MPATEAREAAAAYGASRIFLDTNVLIYALDRDSARGDRAEGLLRQRPFISVQALNEVVNVLRRRRLLPWEAIADVAAQMALLCEVVDQTLDMHRQALALM
ncbi:PIN domain-containing protein, partial [Nostoc sp. NIES-2111]